MTINEFLAANKFDPQEAPYTPILPAWEVFPIVKAIRTWEHETGATYDNPYPGKPFCPCGFNTVSKEIFAKHIDLCPSWLNTYAKN